jgi:hypothetical protein
VPLVGLNAIAVSAQGGLVLVVLSVKGTVVAPVLCPVRYSLQAYGEVPQPPSWLNEPPELIPEVGDPFDWMCPITTELAAGGLKDVTKALVEPVEEPVDEV